MIRFHFHKYKLNGVYTEKETWYYTYKGKSVRGFDYERVLYTLQYECVVCKKIKHIVIHQDECSPARLAEINFFLKDK